MVHRVQGRLVGSGSRVVGPLGPDGGAATRVDYFFFGGGGGNSMIIKFCQIQSIFKLHLNLRKPLTVRGSPYQGSAESKPGPHGPAPSTSAATAWAGTFILKSPQPRNAGFVLKGQLKSYIFILSLLYKP